MPFALNWTGQSAGEESDHVRAIDAATDYCATYEIDPASAWAENLQSLEQFGAMSDDWSAIEWAALQALAFRWAEMPENVSLIWN